MRRRRVDLDGEWEFFPDPEQRLAPESLREAGRRIRVPGPWQAQFADLRDYTGVAWYRRTFRWTRAAAADGADTVDDLLRFGAVDYFAIVWLNGVAGGRA